MMLLEHIVFTLCYEDVQRHRCDHQSTHMVVRQTTAEVYGLMQTAWHQPVC